MILRMRMISTTVKIKIIINMIKIIKMKMLKIIKMIMIKIIKVIITMIKIIKTKITKKDLRSFGTHGHRQP